MSQSFKSPTTIKAKTRANIIGEMGSKDDKKAQTLNSFIRLTSPEKEDVMFQVQARSNYESTSNDNIKQAEIKYSQSSIHKEKESFGSFNVFTQQYLSAQDLNKIIKDATEPLQQQIEDLRM